MRSASRVQTLQGWDVFIVIIAIETCLIVLLLYYIYELEMQNPQGSYGQPPLITLKESAGFSFPLGSAEVSDAFHTNLVGSIIPRILEISKRYHVTVVEVIGHTDEVPIQGYVSNLDRTLIPFLRGKQDRVTAADNVGLGMMRATAVLNILRRDQRLAKFKFVPYSAGQVVLRGDQLTEGRDWQPRAERRRIEISLRKPR
jgi:flagellar motor protein MotB